MARSIEMKWDVLCGDDEWADTDGAGWPPSPSRPVQPRGSSSSGLVLAFLLLVGCAWLWLRAPLSSADVSMTGAGIGAQEGFAEATGGQIRVLDTQTRAEVQIVEGDWPPAYREAHFYEESAAGRQEMPPTAHFWGAEQTIRREFFTIQYRRLDARAAQKAAALLDSHYVAIRRTFGLPIATTEERIHLIVGLETGFHDRGQQKIQLLSPLRLPVPESVTNGDLLLQSAQSVLVDWAIFEMLSAEPDPAAGQISSSLLSALRLWGQWQLDGPLAASRQLQVLAALLPSQANARSVAPLCQLLDLWRPESPGMDFELPCLWLASVATGRVATDKAWSGLPSIAVISPDWRDGSPQEFGGESIVLATLLDYATRTYGPGRLRLFLSAANHHQSWKTLIPAVFDVPAEEFEMGWRVWLLEEYGL